MSQKLLGDYVWDESLFLQVPREIIELLIRYILDADVDKADFDREILGVTNPQIQNTTICGEGDQHARIPRGKRPGSLNSL